MQAGICSLAKRPCLAVSLSCILTRKRKATQEAQNLQHDEEAKLRQVQIMKKLRHSDNATDMALHQDSLTRETV